MANDRTPSNNPANEPAATGFEAITVADYLAKWLAHARSRVRPTTYRGYESVIRNHIIPSLGNHKLSDLHPLHLQDFYAERLTSNETRRALSGGSVVNIHLVLTQALQQAVRWQLLNANPAHGAQPPRPQRPEPQIATGDTLKQLVQTLAGHPLELPAMIAIATGMRRGEVCGLRWADLTPDYTSAHINQTIQSTDDGPLFQRPKTHRSRRAVALPAHLTKLLHTQHTNQQARRALSSNWQHTDLIVDAGDGGPIHPDSLSSAWRRFIRQNNLAPIRFHDLRHSHASQLLLAGIHPKVVSERLGHASVAFTLEVYSHLLPDMQTEAADAIDRLLNAAAA